DRPRDPSTRIGVREDHAADPRVGHEEEVALVSEHRAAMADDANVLDVLDPQPHAVPGALARPHLRNAPCEQALLADERRAVRKSTTRELEAHVACIVLHARPGAAGRPDGA